jgi:hypothetical protein
MSLPWNWIIIQNENLILQLQLDETAFGQTQ